MSTNTDFKLGDFPTSIDNSMRSSFVNCQQKWWYEYIEHFVPGQESIHLHAGKCFAAGLESTRNTFYRDGASFEDSITAGGMKILSEWGDYVPFDPEHNKRLERVVMGLGAYFAEYPMHSDHIQPWKDVAGDPMIEFSFAIPLPIKHPQTGDPLLASGRFDMVANYCDGCYAEDDKTTGQLGASWLNNWKLRSQFTQYAWALQQEGYDCRGVIVRGQSFLKHKFGFAEVIELRPNWMIERWYEQFLREIEQMIIVWQNKSPDLNQESACTAYGGCSFLKLCSSRVPYDIAEVEFIRQRWDPVLGERLDVS